MTNEKLFLHLKRLVEAIVSQQVVTFEWRLIKRMADKKDLSAAEERLNLRIDAIDTKLDATRQAIDKGLEGIEEILQAHDLSR